MGIKEFSGELLRTIYLGRRKSLSSLRLADKFKKTKEEINEVLEYLKDKGLIKLGIQTLDSNYHAIKLKAKGIDFVEADIMQEESLNILSEHEKELFEDESSEEELSEKVSEKKKEIKPKGVRGGGYDFFICHASEDKKDFVEPLVKMLKDEGIVVWYDEDIKWGEDLREKINEGLKKATYGIVILSPSFLKIKQWTEHELSGLLAKEIGGKKVVILPVWHNVSVEDIRKYSPPLSMKKAIPSSNLKEIVKNCLDLING